MYLRGDLQGFEAVVAGDHRRGISEHGLNKGSDFLFQRIMFGWGNFLFDDLGKT
jgi:hypothetical protein